VFRWLAHDQRGRRLAGISVRSLQRKLALADVLFSELIDEVRSELAVEMLQDPAASIRQIAKTLGYSTPSNFARAFERWTGETPGEFRQRR
jgi:AraC-like DNA-binding protein